MRLPYSGPVANKRGRVVLVTGAGSGIGRAIALRQAAAGDIVIATDIDPASAERTAKQAAMVRWVCSIPTMKLAENVAWVAADRVPASIAFRR